RHTNHLVSRGDRAIGELSGCRARDRHAIRLLHRRWPRQLARRGRHERWPGDGRRPRVRPEASGAVRVARRVGAERAWPRQPRCRPYAPNPADAAARARGGAVPAPQPAFEKEASGRRRTATLSGRTTGHEEASRGPRVEPSGLATPRASIRTSVGTPSGTDGRLAN